MNNYELKVKKVTAAFNHFMLGYQIMGIEICWRHKVWFLLAVLCMNLVLTLLNYRFLRNREYLKVTVILYIELVIFMAAGSVSLGMNYGFYLYGVSMTTVLYYVNYVGKKMKTGTVNETAMLTAIFSAYILSFAHSIRHEPLYVISDTMANINFVVNSLSVFVVLVCYMKLYIKTITDAQNELEKIAHCDKLTGLFNRHYLLAHMDEISEKGFDNYWIAILDIDNFKKVNDTYGHNGGDCILKNVASIVEKSFQNCTVCRWGGEEFIILASGNTVSDSCLDNMRQEIADTVTNFENQEIHVTVTVGTERYSEGLSIDKWISMADAKLYKGKNSGKNMVVY